MLALLARERMYGWQLADRLIEAGGLIASIGTMYPVLTRLRERGEVTSYEEPSDVGPPRRYYELTPQGRRSLSEFRGYWTGFAGAVTELLTIEPQRPEGAADVRD